jgi:hypothetical protein
MDTRSLSIITSFADGPPEKGVRPGSELSYGIKEDAAVRDLKLLVHALFVVKALHWSKQRLGKDGMGLPSYT